MNIIKYVKHIIISLDTKVPFCITIYQDKKTGWRIQLSIQIELYYKNKKILLLDFNIIV